MFETPFYTTIIVAIFKINLFNNAYVIKMLLNYSIHIKV